MSDFEGRIFEFFGEAGAHYNIISEHEHQVSMKLKLGQMWDHNGTYMEGIGFQYRDHKIVVELTDDGMMEVFLNGVLLRMVRGQRTQEHVLGTESSELMLLWQLHCPDVGQAVEINTDLLSVIVFLTPAGTRDEGGVIQPAYLNFDAALLKPPAHELKGIVGGSYRRAMGPAPCATYAANDFKFRGVEAEYKMDGYFYTAHQHSAFGAAGASGAAAASRRERSLAEHDGGRTVAFPLRFRIGGVPSQLGGPAPESAPVHPSKVPLVNQGLIETAGLRRHSIL